VQRNDFATRPSGLLSGRRESARTPQHLVQASGEAILSAQIISKGDQATSGHVQALMLIVFL
jgi:hypothetical protein